MILASGQKKVEDTMKQVYSFESRRDPHDLGYSKPDWVKDIQVGYSSVGEREFLDTGKEDTEVEQQEYYNTQSGSGSGSNSGNNNNNQGSRKEGNTGMKESFTKVWEFVKTNWKWITGGALVIGAGVVWFVRKNKRGSKKRRR